MASDKNSIILTAQRLTAKGEIDKAIEAWRSLIAETPNDGNIYNTIGDLYLKKNAAKPAIEAFLKAGTTFQDAGFALKTIAVYKKIIKLDPSRMDVVLKLADVNAERGIVGNAIEDYLKVARHQLKEGRGKAAIEVYRKMAALDPGNPTIGIKLAELCQKEGMIREATEELTRVAGHLEATGKTEGLTEIRAKLAELGGGQPRPSAKVQQPEQSHASLPSKSAETTLMTEAAPPRAEASVPAPAAPAPEPTIEPTRLKTAQEFDENTHERLRDALTETDVYVKYGMLDKAIAHVKALAQREPNDVVVQLKLKELYVSQGDNGAAADVCRRIAELYSVLGRDADRDAMLREAMELNPDLAPADDPHPETSMRADVAAENPPVETATVGEAPNGAADLKGNEAVAQDSLEQDLAEADFYFQQGFDDEAKRLFEAIVRRVPQHALATERLAELRARAATAQPAAAQPETSLESSLAGAELAAAAAEPQHPSLEETSLGASLTLNASPVEEAEARASSLPPRSAETT
ncbi:MAG TPA: tetratricopeptide repeat protein, partial [Nitrospiria bacterium]|nr:tetratricopeptide repeat protein [Nitrospiria bacterium]